VASYYLNNFRVSTPFGVKDGLHASGHKGVDFAGKTAGAAMGMPIPSISGGKVITVFKNNATAGNGVIIQAPDGTQFKYIHMKDTPNLKVGQTVSTGTTLGKIGSTGRSTGPHLDLQVIKNGKHVNGMDYIKALQKSDSGSSAPRQGRQPEGASNARSGNKGNFTPSYTNTWKLKKEATNAPGYKAFRQQLVSVVNSGKVSPNEAIALAELIGRESTWNSGAANKKSSARGYGQFLKATRQQYEKKMKMSYSNPVNQILMVRQYAIDRYGSVAGALKHWDTKNWY
jgi:murein DD-endopeptidase MepM/ murein hydrolase activator NlpD